MTLTLTIRGVTLVAVAAGVLMIEPVGGASPKQQSSFRIVPLDSLGGVNSRGNSINNVGLVAGYSNLATGDRRHATAWVSGTPVDLKTLGGPNSNIAWPVKNVSGLLAGIAQTSTPEPDEAWSCSLFFGPPFATGFTCRGVVWERGAIRALPTLGGRNSFATGANNHDQVVGWSENTIAEPTCAPPQIFQFRAVVWGPGRSEIHDLPLVSGDNSSAATAINDAGQVVGISGTCDQAIGRATAKHAVLWNRGQIMEIPNIGSDKWNTPMAINQRGDIVGFLGQAGDDPDNPRLRAFLWTPENGTENLGTLPGDDYSEARGVNERRQVVGVSCVDPSLVSCRAFLWENGTMSDLNDLAMSPPGDAVLINGQDINDAGVITGRAFIAGPPAVRYAFVAIPVRSLATSGVKKPLDGHAERKRVTMPPDVAQDLRSPMGPLVRSRMSRP